MKKIVSIIVPTFNRFELFLKCIESLGNQDYPKNNYEVICVHDGLKCDYNKDRIKKSAKKIKNFRFEKISHRGVAMVRNYAIRISRGDLILMIDDDCNAKNDWISSYVKYMDNQEKVIGAGGTVFSAPPKMFVQKYIAFKN